MMKSFTLPLAGALALLTVPALAQLQLGAPQPAAPTAPATQTQQNPASRLPAPARQRPAAPAPVDPAPAAQDLPPPGVAPNAQDETVIAPPKQKISNPTAVFSGLDKVTGRIISFDVSINETVQFGALQVTPRVCYTRPPTETPQTTAFVEVAEVTLSGEVRRIFNGWMFAASPGLSGVEHAVYDVWLTDCKQTPPVIPGAGGKK